MSDTTPRPLDLTGRIIEFESDELDLESTLQLFADLVNTGLAWQLQGSYGRGARDLIARGLIEQDTPNHWTARPDLLHLD